MAIKRKQHGERFIIQGRAPLKGVLEVRGAKNAALPVLAATLLTREECRIDNVPLIEDVFRMIEIIRSAGATVKWAGPRSVTVRATRVRPSQINFDLVSRLRASILLIGALVGRTASFRIAKPGGCQLGARIVDPHVNGLGALGVRIVKRGAFYDVNGKGLEGAEFVMNELSVTATENVILAATLAPGRTMIKCAASEPHVQDLCHFLKAMGARIEGIGTHALAIEGVSRLRGARHFVMPDPIEMGTFICLAGAAKSEITIKNVVPQFIEFELTKFKEAGLRFKASGGKAARAGLGYSVVDLTVLPSRLKAVKKVHNMPHPGFAADLIPPFALLMTQAHGVSLIHDWMYEGRLKYVDELQRMGANAFVCDPHRALITGPTPLEGKEITSFDLRAGATLILAGLIAEGETVINNAHQVDRGYEKIEERLQKIGANIRRVKA